MSRFFRLTTTRYLEPNILRSNQQCRALATPATSQPKSYDQLTGNERAAQLRSSKGDRPLDRFVYGAHPISGAQVEQVKHVRMPTFTNPLDERAFRKLHAAACIRWLGLNVMSHFSFP